MGDWSRLPCDIIHKLSTYFNTVEDFVSFSAVCTSWRSVHLSKQWNQPPQIPFLMFSDSENSSTRNLLSLCTNKVYKSYLPEASGSRCWASPLGWLVTVGTDLKINLLNPFTHVSIDLPPISSLQIDSLDQHEIIDKAFVFNKPSENESDLLVMIIYSRWEQLGFCRPGYSSWISIEGDNHTVFIDVSSVKDRIIALSKFESVFVVDIESRTVIDIEHPNVSELFRWYFPNSYWEHLALVESLSGDLWMVHQHRSRTERMVGIEFIVYSYDFYEKQWNSLSGLGDCAIFVGDNCCVCVGKPDRFKCRRNCVYFLGKESGRRWPQRQMSVDVGVYCMDDKSCVPLCCGPESPARIYYSFPIWVVPTLQ